MYLEPQLFEEKNVSRFAALLIVFRNDTVSVHPSIVYFVGSLIGLAAAPIETVNIAAKHSVVGNCISCFR